MRDYKLASWARGLDQVYVSQAEEESYLQMTSDRSNIAFPGEARADGLRHSVSSDHRRTLGRLG